MHKAFIDAAYEQLIRKYELILNSVGEGILGLDCEGQTTFVNPVALGLLGFQTAELIGKSSHETWHRFRPDGSPYPLAECPICSIHPSRLQARVDDDVFWRKDGLPLPIEYNTTPIYEGGAAIGSVVAFRDISQRLRMEKLRASLYRISEAATSSSNLDELYRLIHQSLGEFMPTQNFYIALYDEERDLIEFPYFVDEFDPTPEPKKPGRGLTEYTLRTGTPHLVNRMDFELLLSRGEVDLIGTPAVDWLGAPLQTGGKTIGVMVVQTYTEGTRFTQEDAKLMSFFSSQAAMAIERQRAHEALRASETKYRLLFSQMLDGFVLQNILCDEDGNVVDFQFHEVNPAFERLSGVSARQLIHKTVRSILPSMIHYWLTAYERVAASNQPVYFETYVQEWEKYVEITAFLSQPGLFATLFQDITERKNAEEKLLYLSTHDPLTGIYNRAFFEESLSRLDRSRQNPVSIVVADVDNLKQTNDQMGHSAGDALLVRVAQVLLKTFRAEDIIARIGGDEFAVLLPNTGSDAAREALCRIQRILDENNQRYPELPLSISIGAACANNGASLHSVLKAADQAMYQHKLNHAAIQINQFISTGG